MEVLEYKDEGALEWKEKNQNYAKFSAVKLVNHLKE